MPSPDSAYGNSREQPNLVGYGQTGAGRVVMQEWICTSLSFSPKNPLRVYIFHQYLVRLLITVPYFKTPGTSIVTYEQ